MNNSFVDDFAKYAGGMVSPKEGENLEFVFRLRGSSQETFDMYVNKMLAKQMMPVYDETVDILMTIPKRNTKYVLTKNGEELISVVKKSQIGLPKIYGDSGVFKTSLSKEEYVKEEDIPKEYNNVIRREKSRWSWNLSKLTRLDLTISQTEGIIAYEIEFELIIPSDTVNPVKFMRNSLQEFQDEVESFFVENIYENGVPIREKDRNEARLLKLVKPSSQEDVYPGFIVLEPTDTSLSYKLSFIDAFLLTVSKLYQRSGYQERIRLINEVSEEMSEVEDIIGELAKLFKVKIRLVNDNDEIVADEYLYEILLTTQDDVWRGCAYRKNGHFKTIFHKDEEN